LFLTCSIFRLLLRGLVKPSDNVLPVQLLGNTVAYNISVSDFGKPMEVDVARLLHGRNKFTGHICDQAANYVP